MLHVVPAFSRIGEENAFAVLARAAEFQRQGRDFAAALKAAGRDVTLVELQHFAHLEAEESLGNPYGPNGRAAMAMMGLGRL